MAPLFIFDVDGTVADLSHRIHHIQTEGQKKDWGQFFAECGKDQPIKPVIDTLLLLAGSGAEIKFFSGRSSSTYAQTYYWINHFIPMMQNIQLTMRKEDDFREDCIIKKEMYDSLTADERERLTAVFDDRDQVVKMWRENGVKCYQVAYGDF